MTDRDALYRAVLDHPDDDTPRLVYADYVEEHGDPEYARFIRTQIELAKVPGWDPLWIRAREQDQNLTNGYFYRERFPLPLEGLPKRPRPTIEYRRGFPWELGALNLEQFAARCDALFAAAPIQAVNLRSDHRAPLNDLRPLTDNPHFARLRRLTFCPSRLTADGIRRLTDSPHAAGLTDLGFSSAGVGAEVADALFRSPLLARVTRLRLVSGPYGGFRALDAARMAGGPCRLRSLTVESVSSIRPEMAGLFDAPLFRGLAELNLSNHRLGPDGFAALAASPAAAGLESLTLRDSAPGVPGVRSLAAAPALANLRQLALWRCGLGPVAAKVLATSPHLRNLIDLGLSGNAIGNAGAVALAESPHLRNLVRLDLMYGEIGDRGALALLDSPVTANLVRLDVSSLSPIVRISDDIKRRLKDRFGERVRV